MATRFLYGSNNQLFSWRCLQKSCHTNAQFLFSNAKRCATNTRSSPTEIPRAYPWLQTNRKADTTTACPNLPQNTSDTNFKTQQEKFRGSSDETAVTPVQHDLSHSPSSKQFDWNNIDICSDLLIKHVSEGKPREAIRFAKKWKLNWTHSFPEFDGFLKFRSTNCARIAHKKTANFHTQNSLSCRYKSTSHIDLESHHFTISTSHT